MIGGEWRLLAGGMYEGVHRPGIVYTDWRSINSTFLVGRGFFLSSVRHVCESCVCAEQSSWGMNLNIDGSAVVQKLRERQAFDLAASTKKYKTNKTIG